MSCNPCPVPPAKAALELRDICVDINKTPYVRDVSLTVPEGKIHGVLGPNGAGKTTLLRTCYRATVPSAGSIHAFGRALQDHSPHAWARTVGALVQSSGLLAGLTPRDIVEIGLSSLGLPQSEARTRCDGALDLVGLLDKSAHPANRLSGGELQRCYFAQLLACDPAIYILDEPTNHLDLHYQLVLLDEVKRRGRTVLMTLHDLSMAMRYCDHVYLMSAGQIVANGPPDQVLTRDALRAHYHVDGAFRDGVLSLTGPVQRGR